MNNLPENTPHTTGPSQEQIEAALKRFVLYLLAGDRSGCRAVVEELISAEAPLATLYLQLYQPALYQIGELWERNVISVAREHIATAIVESLLSLTYPQLCSRNRLAKKVVVACAPRELHQIGARMVADHLEMNGWESRFLGANTSVDGLISCLQDEKPKLVCLSLSTAMNLHSLLDAIAGIQLALPELPIAVGGQAFLKHDARGVIETMQNVRYVSSIIHLDSFALP